MKYMRQPQGYAVSDDDGTFLGNVTKHTERYNLRRSITVTYWRAWPLDGKDAYHYPTRRDAVAALQNAGSPFSAITRSEH